MSRFTIYDKDGNVRHESITEYNSDGMQVYADSLEYTGSWMGECFLTVNVKSAYPIDFRIGDYIDYRGERFTINYDPTVVKKARRGTHGEGFVYDGIKFTARHTELADIRFLDYVLYDNELHYTSLLEFPFYAASVDDYCDSVQANTNRWCADNGFAPADYWMFLSYDEQKTVQRLMTTGITQAQAEAIWEEAYGRGTYTDDEKKDVSVSISSESVWNSLARIKNDFGLNFVNRDRKVIIGAAGLPTSEVFHYGKDEGLYEIERNADTEQQVITKLFAYGSDKNMPVRYYANLNMRPYLNVTGDYHPGSTDKGISVTLEDLPYNSGAFTNKIHDNGSLRWYSVTIKVGEIECGANIETAGGVRLLLYSEDADSGVSFEVNRTTQANIDAIKALLDAGTKQVIFLTGVNIDKFPANRRIALTENLPNNMAVSKLMLPGFPNKSLYRWIIDNGGTAVEDDANTDKYGRATWTYQSVTYDAFFSKEKAKPYILSLNFKNLGVREASKVFDGSDDTEEIYPTIEGTGFDVITAAEMITDNGVFGDGDNEPTVTITLPNFGSDFRLNELAETGTQEGGTPTIFMKNGYCGAREFTFESGNVKQNSNGTWEVKCKREYDDLLDLWYPYSYAVSQGGTATADEPYQVRTGDNYVLTGIPMTDTYINANAIKLLAYSLAFLAKNDYTRYTYIPRVDEIFMQRQHDEAMSSIGVRSLHYTIKEGDIMLFGDNDLQIDGSVFIDTLTIRENGNNGIPTYEVTLRNDKAVGTMQRMQNQIDSLASFVSGGGGGLSVQQIRELIAAYGGERFLSKLNDDVANGRITFQQGLTAIVESIFNGIVNNGNIKSDTGDIPTFITDTTFEQDVIVDGILKALAKIISNDIESDNWTGDGAFDTGFQLKKNGADGITSLIVDNLFVRMKAIFNELEIRKISYAGGNIIFSHAGSKVVRVNPLYDDGHGGYYEYQEYIIAIDEGYYDENSRGVFITDMESAYDAQTRGITLEGVHLEPNPDPRPSDDKIVAWRCYLLKDDGTTQTENWWRVDDQARCQTFNIKEGVYENVSNTFYWRKVLEVGTMVLEDNKLYDFIDLSRIDCYTGTTVEGIDVSNMISVPQAGDQLVQMGNRTDTDRQGFISIEVSGEYAPAFKMYKNVSGYTLENKRKIIISPKLSDFKARRFVIETDYDIQVIPMERGDWSDLIPDEQGKRRCYYYDLLQHNGASWLCIVSEGTYTTVEPGDATPEQKAAWRIYAQKGEKGDKGDNGYTPYIENGYWYINGTSTGIKAEGDDGLTPYIGANGNWWIGETDTGVQAEAQSALHIDLSNQMDAVAMEADGKVTAQTVIETDIALYYGTQPLTLSSLTNSTLPTGVTIQKNPATGHIAVTIAKDAELTNDKLDITFTATSGSYSMTTVLTIQGYRKGADGTSPVIYQLLPSEVALKKDKAGTYTPATLTCGVTKRDGNSAPVAYTGDAVTIKMSIDGGAEQNYAVITTNTTKPNLRVTYKLYQGSTLIDVETVHVTEDGVDGTSPFFADIDNEMDSLACDSDGKTTAAYDTYIGVHVWHGSTEQALTKLQTNSITGITITPDATNKHIRVQIASGTQIADVNTINITVASADSGDKTLHFVLNGVRPGANGQHATLYTLVPSVSSVTKKKDGSYSVQNVSCTRQKNVGGTITNDTTDGEIKYKLDGGTEQTYTNNTNIAVTNFTKSIQFIFRVGGVIVDTESIPMVEDGTNGINGTNTATCYIENPNVFVKTDADKKVIVEDETKQNLVIEVPFYVISGQQALAHYDASLEEEGTTHYAAFGGVGVWNIEDEVWERTGSGISIENAYIDGRGIIINDAVALAPSTVVLTIPKNTVLDEHKINITVVALDDDNNRYTVFGAIEIKGRRDGENGDPGEDAVNVVVSPASLIVNQDLNDPQNLSSLSETFVVQVNKGGVAQTVNSIQFAAEQTSGNYYKVQFLKNDGTNGGAGTINGNILTLKNIQTYTEGSGESQKTYYYDRAYADLIITYDTNKNISYRVSIYANLLGTWKETVEAGEEQIAANKIIYTLGASGNDIETIKADYTSKRSAVGAFETWKSTYETASGESINNMNTRISTAEENISTVTKKVDNGKNLLGGVLTGEGWTDENDDPITPIADDWLTAGEMLISPQITVEQGKKYTLSYESGVENDTVTVQNVSGGTPQQYNVSQVYNGRLWVTFTAQSNLIKITFNYPGIRYPQLELGEAPTEFITSTYEISSQIKQTADRISLAITSGLQTTGIDITNGLIKAQTGKFEIWNQAGTTKTFSIDNSGNLVSAGNASFSGKITASSGSIGGFAIGANQINSSNNKIILKDDGSATIGGLVVDSSGNATLTGKIITTSGSIGGFTIDTDRLYNSNWEAGIDISYDSKTVKIGKNAQGVQNTEKAIIRAENTKSNQTYNTALYLNAQNATYNYAFYGNGNGVLNGLVFGYRIQEITIPTGSTDVHPQDVVLEQGSTVIIKGTHTSGHVMIGLPKLSAVLKSLGINNTTTSFAIEISILSNSSYAYISLHTRSFVTGDTFASAEYPVWTGYDNQTFSTTSMQLATGDYVKFLLTYTYTTVGSATGWYYRAYMLFGNN